ncbi:MAG TPA: indolepyruvate ferredoxin oxidoreductase subunit alpha [Candidatus Omnitrophota bacterium]|nr:indolepyruvate ferredoxin oxidoreductase subunit alpha [Candidatus Omnitrophota bacterium]HRZ14314.1 indolepyruvate ferredoxin oxidoreductase subunit alpha [Candidatus Omnitrophota bacterium]
MRRNKTPDTAFLSGDEALAQGAYESGLAHAASYPGTPATEVLEYLSRFPDVQSQWSVNEKVAFEVALGAAIAGLRSLYASKHVGLNVAMDPLMTSAYTGVNAGFVVVVADDPGIHSSQNEQDTRLFAKVAKLPLLEPSSPAEAKAFVKKAFAISEEFDTPVMIRLTTRVAHTKENIEIFPRASLPPKAFKIDVPKYVMVPRNAYLRHIDLEKRLVKLQAYAEKTALNTVELKTRTIGFITAGVSYLYVKEMYPDASVLKLGFSFPFPEKRIREFARSVKQLYVIEEIEPFMEEQLRMLGIKVKAKHPSFRIGELRPEFIPEIVKGKEKREEPSSARKPVLCPGCPHRGVFTVLKKVKAVVTGDIGCYTLGALPPLSSLHSCICMGGGITFFEGFSRGLGKNVVGVIGDSTFVHSGITGLINAAYNKVNGLIMILDNSTTAMTGSQPHPATGVTIKGEPTKKLILEDVCRVAGADNVDVVNPFDLNNLENLVRQRMQEDKLSVIIARFPCRLIDRSRQPAPEYRQAACKKCLLCLSVNCPAIRKTDDGFIELNAAYCSGCAVCVQVCPAQALVKRG